MTTVKNGKCLNAKVQNCHYYNVYFNMQTYRIMNGKLFSAHRKVRYYHHLASVLVCRCFLLCHLEPNLVGIFTGWSPSQLIAWSEVHKTNKGSKGVEKDVSIYIGIRYVLFICFWWLFFFYAFMRKIPFRNMYNVIMELLLFLTKEVNKN